MKRWANRERLQEELGDALERLAVLGAAAEERDELRTEVERLQHILAEARESSAAELRAVVEERDSLTAELGEARELLRQAERVRESQIALEAERDRAVTELERLQTVAAEAQAEAEERRRLLAEEQDLHDADRETLLAQRTVLEQELGSSIEQLAAAASAADRREAQLELNSQRLLEALDAVRGLAAELGSSDEELRQSRADLAESEETESRGAKTTISRTSSSRSSRPGASPARSRPRSTTRCSSRARTATSSSRGRACRRGPARPSSSSSPTARSRLSSRSCAAAACFPTATSASISRRSRADRRLKNGPRKSR